MKRRKSRQQAGNSSARYTLGYAATLAISVLVAGQAAAKADDLHQQSVLEQPQDGSGILSSVDSGWFKDPVERVREADRTYASAMRILGTLQQRENTATASASERSSGFALGTSSSASSDNTVTTSYLLQPASYTPLLDYLDATLQKRTKYLAKLIRWYRRVKVEKGGQDAFPFANRITGIFKRSRSTVVESQTRAAVEAAIERLDRSLSLGKAEAGLVLADLHMWGRYSLPINATRAIEYYSTVAQSSGDSFAQYMVGFGYSTNYGHAVASLDESLTKEGDGDQGAAVLHYTFSALSGRTEAEQTMGYRYWTGIGVPQNCQDALPWYKSAADKAIAIFEDPAGPPGGRHLPPPKVRLADVAGGVYGPGSSAISSHPGSHHHSSHAGHHHPVTEREWNDVLEFYQFHADRGDSGFMFRIGRIYYQGFNPLNPEGGSTLENGGRDFARALRWFMRIARTVWPRDPLLAYTNPASTPGKAAPTGPARQVSHQAYYDPNKDVKLKVEDSLSMAAGLAAGYLGRMYLRGEGFPEQDFQKAFLWFQRGIGQGDRESHNGLGIMYRDGLGLPVDMTKAVSHFQTAAQADHAEALVNLGKYHYHRNEHIQAAQQFEAAIRQGDSFQAYYYLAELNSQAAQRDSTCPLATAFYKLVSERGDWETAAPWWEAERAWTRGDLERALLGYWIMAERGYEVAQNNVAHILDQNKRRLSLPYYDLRLGNMTERLALMFWTRSAAQDNVDALVKMGDYYLQGLGVPSGIPQPEKAAACYGSAASTQVSSLAMHNLGWMHENGIGVSQDFHLAKRYYDLSLETNTEAYLPVTLSLVKLHIRSLYKAVMAGDIKAISLFLSNEYWIDESGVAEQEGTAPAAKPWLWSWRRIRDEFFKRWIGEEMARQQAQRQIQQQEARVGQAPPVDAPASPGQLDPTQAQNARAALESQDDPVEWARRRREDMLQQDDLADDLDIPDFFGDTIGGRGRDGGDDLIETVAILGLCLVLGWLVYIRQARYDGARARRTPTNPVAAQAPTRAQADEAAAAAPTRPASTQNVQQEQGDAHQQDRPVA